MATVFSSQLVPTSSHKELNLSQSQYILCAWTAPSVASCLVSWLIVAMCGHVWPRNPSMSLPSKRVEGDEDITSLGTFASKHASFCRLWNPIHSQCDVESNYKNLSFPVKKKSTHSACTFTRIQRPPVPRCGNHPHLRPQAPHSNLPTGCGNRPSRPRTKNLDEKDPRLHPPHDVTIIWHSYDIHDI